MLFTPVIKRKKGAGRNALVPPFPDKHAIVKGVFTGLSVEVYDTESIKAIYENGFYGKGSKSRGAPQVVTRNVTDVAECLTLELEEAAFLAYIFGALSIQNIENNEVKWAEFLNAAQTINSQFIESFACYMYLKSKGWIIKSGIKFGGNFLIYKKGPRFHHASFIVFVRQKTTDQYISTKDIKGLQRIAETSDKDVLILEVSKPKTLTFNAISEISTLKISEIIVRRFNSTTFVQTQELAK
ncbi:unnamed protein product [Ceratitis capitata]|uniref:tRNA-intron lyase n=1 Tax=Ceratitis capitata TaxID=7213 RepID=W8BMK2_CERCA|nr:unnamed protein product [Ceratitis capitata]